MKRILLIEDDRDIVELVRYNLSREGFDVVSVGDGSSGLAQLRKSPPDLLILDLMLPKLPGLEVCKEIRRDQKLNRLPILILSARADEVDRISGLGVGADDYLVKPFSPRELVARVAALLRRSEIAPRPLAVLRLGNLELLPGGHEVRVGGSRLGVTRRELDLLAALLAGPGRVFSRAQLLAHLQDTDEPSSGERTVDVHVTRLREKLRAARASVAITTVRGVGYKIEPVARP